MKKYLVKAKVYRTHGFLPDFFGHEEKIIIQADSLAHARGQIEKMISELDSSHVVIRGIFELT